MPGDIVADRYELGQLVGSGGMSSVYRAHDRVLERDVALKVLHERLNAQQDVVDRFSREAKLVAGLSHQNIVAVIDRGDHDGRPFIVFEFIAGENLKQLVGRDGPLPVERVLELGIEIARALSYAHQKGFVHRDVKPQNVLLNGKGEAKVTDFGIARPLEAQEGETATGTVLGTCDYISPEQAQGRTVDESTDIYSLGIVLYELLTGDVPFTGDNFVAVAMQHINTPPPPLTLARPEVPPRLEAAVGKALAKDSTARFPSMAAFCAELEACLVDLRASEDAGATGVLPLVKPDRGRRARGQRKPKQPRTAKRPAAPPPVRPSRTRRRRWPVIVVALIAVAIGAAALAYALTQGNGPSGGGGGENPGSVPIDLKAVSSYDPYGDNHTENPGSVSYATDGTASTFWETEHYDYGNGDLNKPGVGIILAAPGSVKVHTITIVSTTPGYRAVIRSSDHEFADYSDDSSSQLGGSSTTFRLDGNTARYYLIWITNLGSANQTKINEVTAN